ncbi:MAG TPA: aldo/keto reductase [Candidatus Saccharimonadales bacterium]|nr:aldo/keto reductase [Candidatus Saccharimonadales bacterium]
MPGICRRQFLRNTATAAAATWVNATIARRLAALPTTTSKVSATDTVTLGSTGIRTSRLAMGTGTVGSGHHSNQTALGIDGLSRLLQNGYDNGLRFFDAADSYGSHPHVADALKHVDRTKVTVLTKSWARTAPEMRADLDRFRKELGTDYLDITLMHCVIENDWTTRYQGAMDALSEARQKGVIRAHGCSCHSIEALRTAAKSPWVEVDLVRINPIGSHMDADPDAVTNVIREMRASGKAVVGMKILGQGDLRHKQDDAIRFALGLNLLDAFTIGAESTQEQMDLIRRIASV